MFEPFLILCKNEGLNKGQLWTWFPTLGTYGFNGDYNPADPTTRFPWVWQVEPDLP